MANTVFDDILGELRMGDTASGGSGGDSLVGGYRTSIAGGTASFVPSADIVTVTGASVTLNPDTAYKIYATTSAVTLNANVPDAGKWAYDGHIELFVAGTGYVVTGSNVVLANALEPDAVNNCTVRFHDGIAIIAVEDHIAGYVVVSATGTTAGTLPYALTSATQEYVAFDASLNGATVSLSGSTANSEKHIVGNGYTETTLAGAVNCGTSKFTVANLSLSDVQVTGGVMTLGDAYIPSGSTVAVSGGGLAMERVSGNGGVIDLGGTWVYVRPGQTTTISGCKVVSGGYDPNTTNGAFYMSRGGTLNITESEITQNPDGGMNIVGYAVTTTVNITSSVVSGNTRGDILAGYPTLDMTISGSTVGRVELVGKGGIKFAGSNKVDIVSSGYQGGTVTISPGASINLTSSINPGLGITVLTGGCTVNGNAIPAGTYTSIDSNGQPT